MKDNFSADSYDKIYASSRKYARHYTGLRFLPVWKYIASLVGSPLVDLGCGCGHQAHLMYDNGFKQYTGYDFSKVAIAKANALGLKGKFKFIQADLMSLVFKPATYISSEVFEHIKDDKELIMRLPEGVRLIFSVPSYTAPNHYRTYKSFSFIEDYYSELLDIESIKKFPQNAKDNIFVVNSIVK